MAVFQATIETFSLSSFWTVVYAGGGQYVMSPAPNTASQTWSYALSGLPAGSTIASAILYSDLGSPATGAALRTVDGAAFNGSLDVTAKVQQAFAGGQSVSFQYKFRANGAANSPAGSRSSTLYLRNNRIDITYAAPTGGSTPPTGTLSNIGVLGLDKTSMDAGGCVTLTLQGVPNIWHRISYNFNGHSAGLAIGNGYGYVWQIQTLLDWINTIPNAASGVMTFTAISYDQYDAAGNTPLNSTSKEMTLTVPANIVPAIGGFTATRLGNTPADITAYVQGYSQVRLEISGAAGAYGSTIAGYQISGGPFLDQVPAITYGPLQKEGETIFTGTVIDSRGRTNALQAAIVVEPYAKPSLSGAGAWRSNADGSANKAGGWVRLISNYAYSAVGGQNAASLQYRLFGKGASRPAFTALQPGVALVAGGGALLATQSYVVEIQAADKLNSYTLEITIPTDTVGLHILNGVKGVGIGKYAERDGVLETPFAIEGGPVKEYGKTNADVGFGQMTGIFYCNDCTGVPTGWGYLQQIAVSENYKFQVFYGVTSDSVFIRHLQP